MKTLLYYLKSRAPLLLGALILWLLFGIVPALEGSGAVFGYAHLIAAAAFLIAVWADFWGVLRRHRRLLEKLGETPPNAANLPSPISRIEADYQALCQSLDAQTHKILQRATASQRESQTYFSLWVHQVKTPIAAARLLLQSEKADRTELLAELFKIEQYAEMALFFSRMGEGASDYRIERCPLDPILRACIRKFARLFIVKKLAVHYDGTDKIVLTDEKWLAFAIEQLLSNALKYTQKGGITISVSGDFLIIEDSGAGIRAEDLPRVFDRGFTGYNGRIDKKATGIGLYLAKRVLTKLGHGIAIESKWGEGTRVTLDLSSLSMRHE